MKSRLGIRYRLSDDALSGSPDLVFPKSGSAILVRGCHQPCGLLRHQPVRNNPSASITSPGQPSVGIVGIARIVNDNYLPAAQVAGR